MPPSVPRRVHRLLALGLAAALLALSACQGTSPLRRNALQRQGAGSASTGEEGPSRRMPDLSGLAWVGGDTLLAVHDAKASPEEMDRPRVSLFRWPSARRKGLHWQTLPVDWPASHGPGSDLESIAHVPGTRQFILVESGANREPVAHLFLAVLDGERLRIQSTVEWPVPVTNVEAAAVARFGEHLVFLYAERSEGRGHADLAWATLDLPSLRRGQVQLGAFTYASYRSGTDAGPGNRPVTALDVGPAGCLYISSAHDEGRDDGPFRSAVWQGGHVGVDAAGEWSVHLSESPRRLATLDGLKAEGVAAREQGGCVRLAVGTDDEWFGAALRPLPSAPACPR